MTAPSTSAQGPVAERPRIEPLLKDGDVVDRLKQFRLRWQEGGDLTYLGKALVDAVVEIEASRIASSPSPAASPASPSGVLIDSLRAGVIERVLSGNNTEADYEATAAVMAEAAGRIEALEARILSALASDATPAPTSGSEDGGAPDMRRVCEALGFDPTNHHNAAKCPYCTPALTKLASEPAGGGVDANGVDMTAVEGTLGAAKKAGIVVSFNDVWTIVTLYRAALLSSAGPAEPVAWVPQSHLDFLAEGRASNRPSNALVHDRPNEEMGWTVPLYAHPAPATVEMLREAARDLIASRSSTYKAKNGRVMGIEDDAGEMMWIFPFDEMAALEAALAPATEGRKG